MEQKDFFEDGYIKIKAEDYEKMQQQFQKMQQKFQNQAEKIEHLQQQVDILRKLAFGQKSEKTKYTVTNVEQLSFFDEAEQEESRKERKEEKAVVVQTHTRKKKRTHDELAKNLPVEEVVHTSEERTCDKCGAEMKSIGKEFVRDELVYIPARLFIRKHYAEVLKCPDCGTDESKDKKSVDIETTVIKKAEVPLPMIPHSFASPELLAHVAYEKYCNGMPLYRQEKDFKGHEVILSRATMANWIIYAAKEWLTELYDKMKEELLAGKVIHADETVVQVLHEEGRKAKTQSRMWVYCAGEIGCKSNILFEYQPTRRGEHAKEFLGEYPGALVCDGYDAYNSVRSATRHGCWAHVRRKFYDALPKEAEMQKGSKAAEALGYCNKLFEIEQHCKEMKPEERYKYRQEQEKPIVDAFFEWLETFVVTGGSALSKAKAYAIGERKYLVEYLNNPLVPISNNRAENAIRPFVVGRKQWLFSNTVKGAKASAVFYSIAATACANGLNVERYFTYLFRTLPHTKKIDEDDLPWSDKMIEKFHI